MNDRAWAEQEVSKAGQQQQENKEGNFSRSNVAVVHNCSTGKRGRIRLWWRLFPLYEPKRCRTGHSFTSKHDVQLLLGLAHTYIRYTLEQLFAGWAGGRNRNRNRQACSYQATIPP
jgi:hypothetical protein